MWKTVKLGDLCETVTKGTTPTSVGFKFTSEGINFVNACSGGLTFRIGLENGESINRRADTIEDGVHWIKEYGLAAAGLAAGSSMDFADEEGFDHPCGARVFLDEILIEAGEL